MGAAMSKKFLLTVGLVNFSLLMPLAAGAQNATLTQVNQSLSSLQSQASALNSENCMAPLKAANRTFGDWMPERAELKALKNQGPDLLKKSFETRLSLHAQIEKLSPVCVSELRDLFRNLRASEDIIGVMFYGDRQISAESIDYTKQPVPLKDTASYRPYFFNPKFGAFQFQKSDLMVTKGISVVSSAISSIAKQPSLFSHIAYVYQDTKTQNFGTIEGYIGKGIDFYTMKEALINENARILVLRPKDQATAERGHDYMFNRVQRAFASGKKISYDYGMDFQNNETLSCEEVAYDAFNTASRGQMQIPYSSSRINVNDKNFLKGAGLKNGPLMLPADMELDPRFDIVLDWTDYRVMRDNWRKDAVLSEILRWINEEEYILSNHYTASLGELFWMTRNIPVLWPLSARITGIPKDYEKQVPGEGVGLMANLRVLGPAIMGHLTKADQAFFTKRGRWMSRKELREQVNTIRKADSELYDLGRRNDFHFFFRPYSQQYTHSGGG